MAVSHFCEKDGCRPGRALGDTGSHGILGWAWQDQSQRGAVASWLLTGTWKLGDHVRGPGLLCAPRCPPAHVCKPRGTSASGPSGSQALPAAGLARASLLTLLGLCSSSPHCPCRWPSPLSPGSAVLLFAHPGDLMHSGDLTSSCTRTAAHTTASLLPELPTSSRSADLWALGTTAQQDQLP